MPLYARALLFFILLPVSATGQEDGIREITVASYLQLHLGRALLLLIPSDTDPRLTQQISQLVHSTDLLAEREVTVFVFIAEKPARQWTLRLDRRVWDVDDPEPQDSLRRRYHVAPHAFTAVLIGKDGGETFRSLLPVPAERLFSLIDATPMRSGRREKAAGDPVDKRRGTVPARPSLSSCAVPCSAPPPSR